MGQFIRHSSKIETHMVQNVAIKDTGHRFDCTLAVICVIITYPIEEFGYGSSLHFMRAHTWARDSFSWRNNMNFPCWVGETQETTWHDRDDILFVVDVLEIWNLRGTTVD